MLEMYACGFIFDCTYCVWVGVKEKFIVSRFNVFPRLLLHFTSSMWDLDGLRGWTPYPQGVPRELNVLSMAQAFTYDA